MSDVSIPQINTLYHAFPQYADTRCWALCNLKTPWDYHRGYALSWSDRDLLLTFHEAVAMLYDRITHGAGIGIFLGVDNNLACFDLDKVITEQGTLFSEEAAYIAAGSKTYSEISYSKRGLHLFFELQEHVKPFKLKKGITEKDGDFYTHNRFIRTTGTVYGKRYPVRILTKQNVEFLRTAYGKGVPQTPVPVVPVARNPNMPVISLADRLTVAGIAFCPVKFERVKEHHQEHGGVIESIETECPNIKEHGQDRNPNAVFYRCADGHIGGRCWHGHCDPEELWERGTSLAKLLFEKIRTQRTANARSNLKSMGVAT